RTARTGVVTRRAYQVYSKAVVSVACSIARKPQLGECFQLTVPVTPSVELFAPKKTAMRKSTTTTVRTPRVPRVGRVCRQLHQYLCDGVDQERHPFIRQLLAPISTLLATSSTALAGPAH
uniref:Uncharacterized protein n=1 Tax=Anopheles minimus TaxID=112268 RepID=A0A182WP08_9DIPT